MRNAIAALVLSIAHVHGFIAPRSLSILSAHIVRSLRCVESCRNSGKGEANLSALVPLVWVEDAEHDFVDEDENLEDGEICIKSMKAFASPTGTFASSPRFLGAGALVQRPSEYQICDVWMADSILDEGGPNLQFQGALKLLDQLLLFDLERFANDPILGLQSFVVQWGSLESPFTCASYMAAKSRGFRPLRELGRLSSIYMLTMYNNDFDGMVLDVVEGKKIYSMVAEAEQSPTFTQPSEEQRVASTIYSLLPDDQTIRRFTHKRFTIPKQ